MFNYVLKTGMKFCNFLLMAFVICVGLSAEQVLCRDLFIQYDIAKLIDELKQVEDEYMPRHGHQDNWTGIPLRNATGTHKQEGLELKKNLKRSGMLPCKNSAFLEQLPYISFIIEDIARIFDTEVGLVRISKVPSRRSIAPHRDGDIFDLEKGSVFRLHIPLITDENAHFEIAGNNYCLEPGKLYYTNVSEMHSVTNNSSIDRIHLIIDVQANSLLRSHILESIELEPLQ